MRILLTFSLFLVIFTSCKQAEEEEPKMNGSEALAALLDEYQDEQYELYPWAATFAGDNRYNNLLPNFYSQEFKQREIDYYSKYKEAIEAIDDADLNENEILSKKIMIWECERNLEGKEFPGELMPVDQFSSPLLMFAQLGSGQSAQPFKTVKDYNDWLERLDAMMPIIDTAMANMDRGIAQGYVIPKPLTMKVLLSAFSLMRSLI